ncbi:SGNH hydrolase [Eremomyces bilateralis CBS 781.70]|uniref:SGNH hydrolase n=1 Tax=Eremomyces bilateralis CBS 781.70 TaxID=1392243 RepID=A0A6G1FPW8_9PEZI|nr:SGNH hydrolase [Eremomyces bilateralis CBS 781.70]KAF1807844.1 SGNH hydrolase [Eremomyces bilateralis CBS 781.70]
MKALLNTIAVLCLLCPTIKAVSLRVIDARLQPRNTTVSQSVLAVLTKHDRRDVELSLNTSVVPLLLERTGITPGQGVKPGTKLRILCVGDSITVGAASGDGNGYRLQLRNNLSNDNVVFAGTEFSGGMADGYFAAWTGKTIQYVTDHVKPSLEQRPNIILLHLGTNDMTENSAISTEGNDPSGAAQRLGNLIDQMIALCPDAIIMVAMIINTCDPSQAPQTQRYQLLVAKIAQQYSSKGHKVIAVDFTTFPISQLRDCIHPADEGYREMGHYWYDFITQIPRDWIQEPVGPDPRRAGAGDSKSNSGPDPNIPPPNFGTNPVQPNSTDTVANAAGTEGRACCNDLFVTGYLWFLVFQHCFILYSILYSFLSPFLGKRSSL